MSCYNVAHYKYIKCLRIIHYMWKSIIKVPRNLIYYSNYISLIKSFKRLKKFIIFNIVLINNKFLFWWKFSVTWYASCHITWVNLILLFHYLFYCSISMVLVKSHFNLQMILYWPMCCTVILLVYACVCVCLHVNMAC